MSAARRTKGKGRSRRAPRADAPAAAAARTPSVAEEVFYAAGVELVVPETREELRDLVRECAERRRCLIAAGLGRHAWLGNLPDDEAPPLVVSLARLGGVLRYEPADFTAGVAAGEPVSSLRETLAANRQEIPIDPAPAGGTIGGAVAAALDGPRRGRHGTYRNVVIGVTGMRGDGSIWKAGGMVVKNVAGYDVGKLLVGSLGTLGIVLEINFKLRPLPARRSGGVAVFPAPAAAWRVAGEFRRRHLEPSALSVLDPAAAGALGGIAGGKPDGWAVSWLFEGNEGTVSHLEARTDEILAENGAADALRSERSGPADAAAFLERLTAFQEPEDPAAEDLAIVRLSVVPDRLPELHDRVRPALERHGTDGAFLADAVAGVVHLRARGRSDALRSLLAEVPGHLRAADAVGRLAFASPALRRTAKYLLAADPGREVARRIQRVFDPAGVFNPGRVYRD